MDYTTATSVFTYGDVEVPSASQTAVMNKIVTAVSRRIDKICQMKFGLASYTNRLVPARVTLDGVLTLYINASTMSTPTAVGLRVGNLAQLLPVNLDNVAIEENPFGCKVLFYGQDFGLERLAYSIKAYATYSAGWATLADVPPEFEQAATQLAWFVYKQRAAPMNSTAVPELGIITLPASIQPDILDVLKRYTWWWS